MNTGGRAGVCSSLSFPIRNKETLLGHYQPLCLNFLKGSEQVRSSVALPLHCSVAPANGRNRVGTKTLFRASIVSLPTLDPHQPKLSQRQIVY